MAPVITLQPPPLRQLLTNVEGVLHEEWSRFFVNAQAILSNQVVPVTAPLVLFAASPAITGAQNLGVLASGILRQTVANGSAVLATSATISLATEVAGNLATSHLASGVGASGTTFWRGDGQWAVPAGTGVSSITGTANQIIASASTGAVTLSLPQNIATTSNVRFSSLGLGGVPITAGGLALYGATSGVVELRAAAIAGANTITFPAGTTNFSATGGTNQVVKQSSAGAAFTVGTLASSNLSDASNIPLLNASSNPFTGTSLSLTGTASTAMTVGCSLSTGFSLLQVQNDAGHKIYLAQNGSASATPALAQLATDTGTDVDLTIGGASRGRLFHTGGFSWGDTTDPGATNLRVAGTLTQIGAATFSAVTSVGNDIAWTNDTGFGLMSFVGPVRFLSYTSGGGLILNAPTQILANGLQVGAPTGGQLGSGWINVASGVKLNNTAYTNPDYVFEHFYRGAITKFAQNRGASDYPGLWPLTDVEAFARRHWQLPLMAMHPDGDLFERGDLLMASVEQAFLYLFDIEKRLKAVEAR